jgi:hypothetical protein
MMTPQIILMHQDDHKNAQKLFVLPESVSLEGGQRPLIKALGFSKTSCPAMLQHSRGEL